MWWADVLSPANQMLACVGGGPTLSEAAAAAWVDFCLWAWWFDGETCSRIPTWEQYLGVPRIVPPTGALKFMRHLLQCLEGTKSNDGPAVAALDAGQKGKGTGPSQ